MVKLLKDRRSGAKRSKMKIHLFLVIPAITSFIFFLTFTKTSTYNNEFLRIEQLYYSFEYILVHNQSLSPTTNNDKEPIHNRRYLPYDQAGPKPIPGTARSHHLPNAIPTSRTIPRQFAEDKAYHISQRRNTSKPLSMYPLYVSKLFKDPSLKGEYNWNHSYETDYRTLYLYNPSILPLHNTIEGAAEDPDNLSPSDLEELTGGDPSVRYVATYRAYTGSNCFGPDPDRAIMKAGEQISYLALALLDSSLNVVPGTDVLMDLNASPVLRGVYWRQFMEDCRIFMLRGGLYLLCNEQLMRVKITRTTKFEEPIIPPGYGSGPHKQMPYVFSNIYGTGLQVTLLGQQGKVSAGKNFNFFRAPATNRSKAKVSTGPYDYYLQTYPSPHTYQRVNIPPAQEDVSRQLKIHIKGAQTEDRGLLPQPTFDTPDTHHHVLKCIGNETKTKNCTHPVSVPFFENEEDHGSACCVTMTLSIGRQVLVGISHQKLSKKSNFWKLDVLNRYDHFVHDHFVSRFIAYDVNSFEIVARSGWFCLGFANEAEESSLAGTNTHARLYLFNDTFACPAIHFISGFAEVVGDDSRAIIGYGVNDCHPRMFMVEKKDIVELLTS